MKKLMMFLLGLALLFGATKVKAGEVSDFLLGMSGALVAHEFVGHGANNPEGAEQSYGFRSMTGWSSFSVKEGYDRKAVIREASINGLATQTMIGELAWSSGIGKSTAFGRGLIFGNALYQVVYPVATIFGEGEDVSQFERAGGSKAVKYGLLALGSYRLLALATDFDPLSDGKGVELVAGIDAESGGLSVGLKIPF